jgi:putative phosphoesterase
MQNKSLKIAILSDIHGNLPALEAVLADCTKQGAEQIWNLGDFIGYVPFPNEVIERLQNVNAISIIGNYDLKVLSFAKNVRQWKKIKDIEKYTAFDWNYNALTPASRHYLQTLPKERRIEVGGLDVLLTHGSPADNEEGIGSAMPAQRLNELAKIAKADVVVCGHTHRPFQKRAGGVLFVNAGSVGRPEGDPRATYAILDFAVGGVKVVHHRVEYDIDRATNAIRKAALSAGLADVIEKAVSLDILKQQGGKLISDGATDEKKLKAVLALAEKCDYEKQHTHQVEKLALQLFDGLTGLHQLGKAERFLLRCGAILHDIGWIEGQKGHHKVALKIIMEDNSPPFDSRDKTIIALLARYHRKRLPADKHPFYRELIAKDKIIVQKLAGILRIADGLVCSHRNLITSIDCDIKGSRVVFICCSKEPLDEEFLAADEKADLLKRVFGIKTAFQGKQD